jgi:hypothetical protein
VISCKKLRNFGSPVPLAFQTNARLDCFVTPQGLINGVIVIWEPTEDRFVEQSFAANFLGERKSLLLFPFRRSAWIRGAAPFVAGGFQPSFEGPFWKK